jgi:hypothetical protein
MFFYGAKPGGWMILHDLKRKASHQNNQSALKKVNT